MTNHTGSKLINIRIGDFCEVVTGGTPNRGINKYWNGDIPWMNSGEINQGRVVEVKEYITKEGVKNSNAKLLQKGTVMIALNGQGKTRGKAAILEIETTCNQSLAGIIPKDINLISTEYLWRYLSYRYKEVRNLRGGEFRSGLNLKLIRDIPVLLPFKEGKPDIEEQKRIAHKLGEVFSYIEKMNKESIEVDRLLNSLCSFYFKHSEDNETVQLGKVCKIVKGRFPTLKTPEGKYSFVVTAAERKTANNYQFDEEAVCIPLVSSTGHGHASLKRIHYQKGKFALANIMAALLPKNKDFLLPKYLYYYLSYYKDVLLVTLMRGGANVTIPINELSKVKVNIPEKGEQTQFIKKVEIIEKLVEKLAEREKINSDLSSSVFNYAFQGKL